MPLKFTPFFLFIFILAGGGLKAQKVTVSPDISIRNNIAYDIIGRVGERILFYKEKGSKRDILIYDDDLVFQSERQINLDEKRCFLYEVINLDTAFAVVYGYRKDGNDITKLDVFTNTAERVDSVFLTVKERHWKGLNFETITSQDETKLALFVVMDENLIKVVTVDAINKEVLNESEFNFKGLDLYNDIVDIQLSNSGEFYVLIEQNNSKNRKKEHVARIYRFAPHTTSVDEIYIPLTDLVCQDLQISINESTGNIGLAGLYDEKRKDRSTGFFWLSGDRFTFNNQEINLIPFDDDIFFEVYGERKSDRLENFQISEIIWKADATPIVALEMAYDISRGYSAGGFRNQAGANTYGSSAIGSGPAWSDHYRDDLVLISIDKEGKKEWHQVFYKKQFSQNDNAVFSSFFPFITPSRLRLIYNDEIKNNSTVSEYILDGSGNYKRTSVLSTEYQNLRLRFADASQISSTELLVPSQKNYAVNLVKIDFSRQ